MDSFNISGDQVNPFGRVTEGLLALRGKILSVKIMDLVSPGDDSQKRRSEATIDVDGVNHSVKMHFDYDYTVSDVSLLPLLSDIGEGSHVGYCNVEGLILLETRDDQEDMVKWKRLGTFLHQKFGSPPSLFPVIQETEETLIAIV